MSDVEQASGLRHLGLEWRESRGGGRHPQAEGVCLHFLMPLLLSYTDYFHPPSPLPNSVGYSYVPTTINTPQTLGVVWDSVIYIFESFLTPFNAL